MSEQIGYSNAPYKGRKPNALRELINAGKPTVGTRLFLSAPIVTEAAGNTGKYDYVEFLAEYAPVNQHDFENIARAAELHGMGTMVKVDWANRVYVAQKAVASGFQAVLFADHRNAEDVSESVKSLRADCPMEGGRFGFTPRRFIGYSAGFSQMQFADMLRDVVCCFMIEKKEAVEGIEEICSAGGVDMIQFGPADYAMSLGMDFRSNMEKVLKAEEKCIKAALKHGVRPRAEIMSPDAAKRYIDLGVRDFNIGGDLWNLASVWASQGASLREIMEGLT
ncbi:MAG: 2,4-dihydroxyhept-2-ene-1,7-dioic acid aldolase [Clostridiales bacterium]|nr:2,4-dihydroxyhept-2-ene-1,7-dioic acid aldolase [Clostridiales bacterium]